MKIFIAFIKTIFFTGFEQKFILHSKLCQVPKRKRFISHIQIVKKHWTLITELDKILELKNQALIRKYFQKYSFHSDYFLNSAVIS